MSQAQNYMYMWRCAKCFYHFANIAKIEGMLKEEKKCPKCKSLNILTLTKQEIILHCKVYDQATDGYHGELREVSNYEDDSY